MRLTIAFWCRFWCVFEYHGVMKVRKRYNNQPVVFTGVVLKHSPVLSRALPDSAPWPGLKPGFRLDRDDTTQSTPTRWSPFIRWVDASEQMMVRTSTNSISIETTDYPGYEAWRDLVRRALEWRMSYSEENIGIHSLDFTYIDEIRVPDVTPDKATTWNRWINDDFIVPDVSSAIEGLDLVETRCQHTYQRDHITLTVEYGPVDTPGGIWIPRPLRRKTATPSPYYSVRSKADTIIQQETLPANVMKSLDAAHQVLSDLFDRVTTTEYKEKVLTS